MKAAHFVVLGLLAAGCGGGGGLTYKLDPSPNLAPPPQAKDANCQFLIGKGPTDNAKYDKLGELKADGFAADSQDDLKGSISAQVCQLGGDYVIATQDETGKYRSVTVLRHHMDAAPDSAAVPVPNAPSPAGAPAPAGSGM
jgi:hypothetical protein